MPVVATASCCIYIYTVCAYYTNLALNYSAADWLSFPKHTENRDQEISGIEYKHAYDQFDSRHPIILHVSRGHKSSTKWRMSELQMLEQYIFRGWLHTKDEVESGVERYWLIIHEVHNNWWCCKEGQMNNCTLIFCSCMILEQLHSNHIGIEGNITLCERVSKLGQYEWWYGADSEAMCQVLKVPMHIATGNKYYTMK